MNYRKSFWTVFVASLVLFFAPITGQERAGLGIDKLVHLGLFAGLFYLGDGGYRGNKGKIIILLAVYVLAVEIVQGYFLPYRSFDLWDMVAGWAGLIIYPLFISPYLPAADKGRK